MCIRDRPSHAPHLAREFREARPRPALSRFDGGLAGRPMSRERRARPPLPRPSRATTPAHGVSRVRTLISRVRVSRYPHTAISRHPRTPLPNHETSKHPSSPHTPSRGSYAGGSRERRASPSLPRREPHRPRPDPSEGRPANARFTNFPWEGGRMRGPRILSLIHI